MNRELEEHALSIVLQLAESPAGDRDGLRNQLCGDDAPLSAVVADLWRAHEEAERKEFWQRPAHAMLGPSESPAEAQDWDNKASPDFGTQAETPTLAESARQQSDQARKNAESAAQDAQPRQPKSARFVAIERLGEGAQGEVWLMLDPEIDRRVAMKILRPKQKGSLSTLTLFRREAEVSGKLEHPNIVPVYDVTAELDESGQADLNSPCYVMRVFGDPRLHVAIAAFHERPRSAEDQPLLPAMRAFDKEQSPEHRRELEARLEGFSFDPQQPCDQTLKTAVESILKEDSEAGTLTKAITKLHAGEWSEKVLKKLLNRFQRICEGVAYAHSRGVIHRDLKPDNIMLGEYGETLVADWGLAKIVGRDDENQSTHVEGILRVSAAVADLHQTQPGEFKGTPAYTSPEQAMGRIDQLGPPADVYSLGAILYHILTGRPTFKAKTLDEARSLIFAGKFPRSTEINSAVPKPLEAIVLKAMSLKPHDRYAKVLDLAADVERWLNDEPVQVYRDPMLVRARRWGKRHRAASAAIAVTVIAGVVLGVVQWQHAMKLDAQETITARETRGKQRALAIAVESLEGQTELIRHEDLLRQPQMLALRLRLLQHALNAYEKWTTPEVDSRELVLRVATQLLQVAESVEETIPELSLLQNGASRETAVFAATEAHNLLTRFLQKHGDDSESELMQAAAGRQLAGLMLSHGEETRAEQQYQMSLAICDRLLAAPARLPSTVSMKLEFERSRIVRGFAQIHYARAMHARHPDERLLHLARALERLRSLRELSESAAGISSRMESAKNYNATAITLHKMGRLDEAIPIFHQAIALCDLMRTRLSDTAESPVERIAVDRLEAQILNNLTLSVHAQVRESGDWETPLALHERSRVLRQGILDRYPWMLSVRMELAQTLGNIADTLSDAPDMAREIEARRAAIDLLHTLVTEFPSSIKIREFWALHRIRWMTALHRLADDQQAAQVFQETIRVEPAPENAEPTNSGQLLDTALGWVLLVQHNPSHNETALQQAEALLLRCHSVGGFESPAVLFRLLQDPAFASVRERPAIQKLLPASSSTPSTSPEPKSCNAQIQTTIM